MSRMDRLHIIFGAFGIVLGLPPWIFYMRSLFHKGSNAEEHADWTVGTAFLAQNVCLILLLLLFSVRCYNQYRTWARRYEVLKNRYSFILGVFSTAFHNLTHMKRDLLLSKHHPRREIGAEKPRDVLQNYCDDIKGVFEALFSDRFLKFNVTIKAINSRVENGDFTVVALARDRIKSRADNHEARHSASYQVLQNTAFHELLKVSPPWFYSDDLEALARDGRYENTSPDWRLRYNATMVVPIRKNAIRGDHRFELVGYIGVDTVLKEGDARVFSMERGGPQRELIDFLLGYADSLYAILTGASVVGPDGIQGPNGNSVINQENFAFINEIHRCYLETALPGADGRADRARV